MSFPRYESMRDAGVELLGHIPRHWDVSRLGFESWVRARLGWKGLKAEEYVHDGYVLLSTPNIKGSVIDFENVNFIDERRYEESPEIKLCVGDVLLAKDGSTLGTVNLVRSLPRAATVNSSIAVITPRERLTGSFLCFLFQSSYIEHTIQRIKGGMGVPHLFQEDLNRFSIPLPTVDEQRAIAAFLDRETVAIDALMAEQQRLIGLLKEKRRAVISHAVTKGLNPATPMKDSGIEWLGMIPKHWNLNAFRRVAQIEEGQVSPTDERFSNCVLIAPNHIEPGTGRLLQRETAADQAAVSGKYRVRAGEVVYSKIRPALNKICIAETDCLCSADMYPIRVSDGLLASYLLYLMLSQSFVKLMVDESLRVAMPKVNRETLYACRIAVPPIEEQKQLAQHIASSVTGFDALIVEAERSIALLQERRTALISAAVTGKIDVRGVATGAAA